ncbi:phospholipase D family protein [Chelativorans sp. Marseille-P2723]|uniref:phospholipase D-like domain-containing protein n=1 Tax=Chelativorans sp. Marseille-P2723 TaxID=2709133 RepID=UPI00156FB18B|nr:phospholipase D family protein [Chelativorans sp. Marseille-P2723]
MLKKIGLTVALVAGVPLCAHFIFMPPPLEGRTASRAVSPSPATTLGKFAVKPRPNGDSGVLPLIDGPDSFAARIALIRTAELALDVQYYIWQRDATGLILLDELRKAAARGVRVRLLLDDNGITGLDEDLAALDALPNVEVRLFNPFILRKFKLFGYAFDFLRLNRRMHNKALTADGAVSILGGRNIGDVYFGFGDGVQFIDTDVIVAGKAAADVGTDFDRYWHSGSSHPVARIIGSPQANSLERLISDARRAAESAEGRLYFERLRSSELVGDLIAGRPDFEWTEVTLVSDDPAKGLGKAENRDLLFPQLMSLLSMPTRSVDLVSAYFIPGRTFSRALRQLADGGVRVRILTNSQAATDVIVVHSAYVKYRPELLQSGIKLYELKPEHAIREEPRTQGLAGSSRASLHSKTLAVDGQRIFIGSFNFDPRSFHLNTEMGVLIDSPRLAEAVAAAFVERFPQVSYLPVLTGEDGIVWDEVGIDGERIRHYTEPQTSPLSRLFLRLLGLLPIEWLL